MSRRDKVASLSRTARASMSDTVQAVDHARWRVAQIRTSRHVAGSTVRAVHSVLIAENNDVLYLSDEDEEGASCGEVTGALLKRRLEFVRH
jgi:hypothetical protein